MVRPPLADVRLVTKLLVMVVTVSCTRMLLALMLTPVGELTVNVNAAAGWNIFVPFG